MQLEVRLKSPWWVQKFSSFIHENQKAETLARKLGDRQIVKEDEENTRQYLREISVMQEIWATSRVAGSQPQRMAILLWRFKQARDGEAATTSWRRIIAPVSPLQAQSPSPNLLQAPAILDSALVELTEPNMTQPFADFYNPHPSIYVDTSESLLALGHSEGGSSNTSQTADYQSFPSSTSTSFPSSISSSTYAVHSSHELGHDSQESEYPVFGSFDSQESTYNSAVNSQGSYESQDHIYSSQDSVYHTVTTPLYEYPALEYPVPHRKNSDDVVNTHDFTGGDIQLMYVPHAEPAPAYEPPLIAPRANTGQQSQIIEHLENFEYHDPSERHQDLDPDQNDLQQTYAEHFEQHNIDLNLLATQFNAWEDQMNDHQEVEHHVVGHVVEEIQQVSVFENQQESRQNDDVQGQNEDDAKEVPLESQLDCQRI
ncbi:hypothetical protein P7C71_g556, partial [Lecanoromycetidae sp. Uapishka_2]